MSYGKFALVYDRLMEDMPYKEWIAFAEEGFRRFKAAPKGEQPASRGKKAVRQLEQLKPAASPPPVVVDLGCGTGNISIPLAARGYRVYGIDLSEEMLSVARDKSLRQLSGPLGGASRPTWLAQDMREWELDEPADAVVSFCDSLNYITEEDDVAEVFRRTFQGLKPGGIFLFDVHTERTLQDYGENQPFVYNEDELSYIWQCEYDADIRLIRHELTFFVRETGGRRYERFDEVHEQRAYPLPLLAELLADAGFAKAGTFADFGWQAPDKDTSRAFFAAVKPA